MVGVPTRLDQAGVGIWNELHVAVTFLVRPRFPRTRPGISRR
jgi:hypothetical protein